MPALYLQGVFSSLCDASAADVDGHADTALCPEQSKRLNLWFTLAMAAFFVFMFVWGRSMDSLGARSTMLCASLLHAASSVCVGFGDASHGGLVAVGLMGWGCTSPGVFTAAVTVPKLFVDSSSTASTCVIGAFDAAAVVFLFLRLLLQHTALSWVAVCAGYAVLTALLGCAASWALPTDKDVDAIDSAFDGHDQDASVQDAPKLAPQTSWLDFARTPGYVMATGFIAVFSLRNSFYISTLREQLLAVDPGSASSATLAFNVVFPAGGIVSIPLVAALMGACRHRDDIPFGSVWLLGVLHGVLNAVTAGPSAMRCQYAAIALFAVLRSLKWATVTTFFIKHFPLRHFGVLLGVTNVVIGLFTLLVYPLYTTVHRHHTPSFTLATWVTTGAEAACVVVPVGMYLKFVRDKRDRTQQDSARFTSSCGTPSAAARAVLLDHAQDV